MYGLRAKLLIVFRKLRVLNIPYRHLITSKSTFIKWVNSVQKSHQPIRAQSEKTIRRLETLLRTTVIKKWARNIPL